VVGGGGGGGGGWYSCTVRSLGLVAVNDAAMRIVGVSSTVFCFCVGSESFRRRRSERGYG